MELSELKVKFTELYGGETGDVRLFLAPARINLIGEHIDYNGGFVFPAAIELRSACAVRVREDGVLNLASTSCEHRVHADISELKGYGKLKWGGYQMGVLSIMKDMGYAVCGMDMLFDETVPHGGGLSASAAIELATAIAAATVSKERAGTKIDRVELALIGQRAENEYVGMNCGIMDQYASAMGKRGHAMLLDCAKLTSRYARVELEPQGLALVIMNTNKPHSLITSAYNERRAECEEALADLKKAVDISHLCDLDEAGFKAHKGAIRRGACRKRAEHAVYENQRTLRAFDALNAGDTALFGALLTASHESLRDLYEVTGAELDAIVDAALAQSCCTGARMMGGGFGGCALALVRMGEQAAFKKAVGERYQNTTGYVPSFYETGIDDGAREVLGV
ncbi:MAG: galactokinase [Eubacteriales bacterium]|nr:galactokinase [Eubacteriales bacterium]